MEGQNAKSSPTQRNDGGRGGLTNINLVDLKLRNLATLTWFITVEYEHGKELVKQSFVMLNEETRRAHCLDHVAEEE